MAHSSFGKEALGLLISTKRLAESNSFRVVVVFAILICLVLLVLGVRSVVLLAVLSGSVVFVAYNMRTCHIEERAREIKYQERRSKRGFLSKMVGIIRDYRTETGVDKKEGHYIRGCFGVPLRIAKWETKIDMKEVAKFALSKGWSSDRSIDELAKQFEDADLEDIKEPMSLERRTAKDMEEYKRMELKPYGYREGSDLRHWQEFEVESSTS